MQNWAAEHYLLHWTVCSDSAAHPVLFCLALRRWQGRSLPHTPSSAPYKSPQSATNSPGAAPNPGLVILRPANVHFSSPALFACLSVTTCYATHVIFSTEVSRALGEEWRQASLWCWLAQRRHRSRLWTNVYMPAYVCCGVTLQPLEAALDRHHELSFVSSVDVSMKTWH